MLIQSLTEGTQFESQNIIGNTELLSEYNCKTILVQGKSVSPQMFYQKTKKSPTQNQESSGKGSRDISVETQH